MKSNSKIISSIIGLISTLLKNLFSFFLTPLMISVFGPGNFGVYKIVLSTTGYFMLLDMGMHNVIVRYISKFRYANDKKSQNQYMGLVLLFYSIINILILFVSVVVFNFIPSIFGNSLNVEELNLFSSVFILLTINSMITMSFNTFGGVIKAHEKFVVLKNIDLIKSVVRSLSIYMLLINNYNVISVVIVDLVLNLVLGLIKSGYVFYRLKLRPSLKGINLNDAKEVLSYTSFIFVNMIALQLFWASDNIILGILTNSVLVAIYSTGSMINSYFQAFANIFSEFLMPSAVKMVEGKSSREEISMEAARIGRLIFIFLGLIIVGFAFLGDKFIVLWLGEDFKIAYSIALIVMVPQLFTYSQNFAANIMWAKGMHKARALVMLLIALLNVGITIFLVNRVGIIGAAIGTSFAYVCGYLLFSSWYYHKMVGINMLLFTTELMRKIAIAYIPIFGLSLLVRILLPGITWITFFIQVVLIIFVYCSLMYILGMNNSEKKIIVGITRKFYRKKGVHSAFVQTKTDICTPERMEQEGYLARVSHRHCSGKF